MTPLAPFAVSLTSGIVLVPLVRAVAQGRGWVAEPKADRWHHQPTALMGGVAIWAATLAGIATSGVSVDRLWGILLGGSVLFALGVVDDALNVKPATKLVAQIVAAAIAVESGFQLSFFESELLNLALSFFWIVAITNAVNLLDNMDGLAAGVVLIAAAYVGWNSAAAEPAVAMLALSLVGSLGAFLIFNVNPASIFMGDSGSMFIGFMLAVLALSNSQGSGVLSFVLVPAATMLVPILDTTVVTATRILQGRSIAEGGRDHTSHRLVQLGLSEREAVTLLWLLAIVAGASAVLAKRYSYELGLGLLPAIIIGFGLLGIYLSQPSFVDQNGVVSEERGYVRLAVDLSYKRRVLEVLLDLVLIVACYYLAYGLRFEFEFPHQFLVSFYRSLPLVVACTMLAFFYQGVYRGVWTYIGTEDLVKYVKACALAVLLSVFAVMLVYRFDGYPRSVFAMFGLLMFVGVGGTRISFRLMDEALGRRRPGRPVLVVGAGSGGEIAARELLRNTQLGLKVAGFADDDRLKHGRRIHGHPVLGSTQDLERLYREVGFEEIVLSTRKISADALARVRSFSERSRVPLRYFRVELLDDEEASVVEIKAASGMRTRVSSPGARGFRTSCLLFALAGLFELLTPGCSAAFSRPPGPDDPAHRAEIRRLMDSRRPGASEPNYSIGPGDQLEVRVPGMEELTGTFSVSEEGTVIFPLVGSTNLAGLSERQAAERLKSEISRFIVVPEVTLSVSEFHGRQVSVIGALGSPGVYPLRATNETLADVITEAGGITHDAGTRIYFTPAENGKKGVAESGKAAARLGLGGLPDSFGQSTKVVPIDLTRLYEGKSVPELAIPLRHGDSILVPKGGEVYVDGWVNTPGAFPLSRALTLSQAISNAGGLHFAASSRAVTLQRLGADSQLETYQVDYQSIVAGRDPDLYLDTGDRLQVAANPAKVVPWGVYAFVKGILSFGVGGGVSVGK